MFRFKISRGLVRFGEWFIRNGIRLAGTGEVHVWFRSEPNDFPVIVTLGAIALSPVFLIGLSIVIQGLYTVIGG